MGMRLDSGGGVNSNGGGVNSTFAELGPESKKEGGTAAGSEHFVVSFAVLREPGAGAGLRTVLRLLEAWMVALEPRELGDSEP